jgi:hypothetical protein
VIGDGVEGIILVDIDAVGLHGMRELLEHHDAQVAQVFALELPRKHSKSYLERLRVQLQARKDASEDLSEGRCARIRRPREGIAAMMARLSTADASAATCKEMKE